MTAPFSAIETATASSAVAALANVDATIGGATVRGIFDDAYQDLLGISGSSPAMLCASADVSAVAQGAAVTINSVAYTVSSVQPDGAGMTRLLLSES